ncbi:hypothetical protein PR003_g23149 [Phytophthora rubi]|uniref:Uncharacterized protein n=1 Tax=Phytophthora rubi TaxID=129364 RepID=A0A6A4D1R4_9STRA|nr:hypothetical protein PR003_g23149 [Phytophthora rubi]
MSNIGRSGAPVLQQESPPVASPPPAPVRTRRIQVKAAVSYQGMLGPATKRARKICPRYEIDMLIDHRTEAGTEHSGGVTPLRRDCRVMTTVDRLGRRRRRRRALKMRKEEVCIVGASANGWFCGQACDIRHAISRVRINGVYYLIESDHYGHMRCTTAALRRLLARIGKIYAIEERIEIR